MLRDREGQVSVWLARDGVTDEALDAYLEEHFDGRDDDEPLSAFVRDLGARFVDHDFQERIAQARPVEIGLLLEHASYAESFLPAVVAAASARGIARARQAVVLYDQRFEGEMPTSSPLLALGSFPFRIPDGPARPARGADDHEGIVSAIDIASNGRIAVSGDQRGELIAWDLERGALEERWKSPRGTWILGLVLLPTSAEVATLVESSLLVCQLGANGLGAPRTRYEGHHGQLQALALDPSGAQIVFGGVDGALRLCEIASEEVPRSLPAGRVAMLHWLEPDLVVWGAETRDSVTAVDPRSGSTRWEHRFRPGRHGDGATLAGDAVLVPTASSLEVLDAHDGRRRASFPVAASRAVRCGDAVVAAVGSRLVVLDPRDEATVAELGAHDDTIGCLTAIDDRRVVSSGRDGRTSLWDVGARRELSRVSTTPANWKSTAEPWEIEPYEHRVHAARAHHVIVGEASGNVHRIDVEGDQLLGPR